VSFRPNLEDILLNHLPTHTKGFNNKEEFSTHFIYEKTDTLILQSKFLRFNTKKFTNILIFDIDEFPSFHFKPSLSMMHQYFYQMTGFEPSWTVQTDKGYHIALILEEKVFNTWQDNQTQTPNYQALIQLKKEISSLIEADFAASNRSYGIWRNPLTHTHIFTNKTHHLSDLLEEFDITPQKPKSILHTRTLISNEASLKMQENKNNKILESIKKGFYIGNRNHYIFAFGYKLLFENRTLKDSLETLLQKENTQHKNPLTKDEIKNITKSILKLSSTMYEKQIFKTKRGKLSDLMWKLNIHGISTRRAFAGWHTSKERRKETLTKLIESMVKNFQNNQTSSPKELAQSINRSTKTIQRYENDYNLKSMVFLQWHKANSQAVQSEPNAKKIDIRPFVQSKLLESLQSTFSIFSPSSVVEVLDFRRKEVYLGVVFGL
jgi:hypothetical protein